ncbi:MAG: hypothetical protein ACKOD2_10050 [Ilumatobacteraceae bacterium]
MDEMMMLGVPLVVIVPAMVEVAKHSGLPTRWAGLVAMVIAMSLVAIADLGGVITLEGQDGAARVARWVITGVVYGLAGAGVYSQVRRITEPRGY